MTKLSKINPSQFLYLIHVNHPCPPPQITFSPSFFNLTMVLVVMQWTQCKVNSENSKGPTYGHASVLVGENVISFGSENFDSEEGEGMPVFMLDLGTYFLFGGRLFFSLFFLGSILLLFRSFEAFCFGGKSPRFFALEESLLECEELVTLKRFSGQENTNLG